MQVSRSSLLLIAVFVLVASGCRFAAETSSTPQATEAIVPAEGAAPGNYEFSLEGQGPARDVIVHLPPAYDGEDKLPLIIVLHGGGQNAEGVQRLSEMDADADEVGFVVAYPDGSGRLQERFFTWNAGHCCGYALENNIDDVAFIELLIDNLIGHYAIDPHSVYITGISNGGMMTYRAGAELADKVAGIAPIAASLGGRVNEDGPVVVPSTPREPVAVIAFHGMNDQHVLYEGGIAPEALIDGRIDLSVEESIRFWVVANGCDPQPAVETQADGNIIIETYGDCEGSANVVRVAVVDGGHAWPGASRGLVADPPTQDISANELMLQFFLEHPKQ